MKVFFSSFASSLEAAAEVSGAAELFVDVLQPVKAAAKSPAPRKAELMFVYIRISFLCVDLFYFPAQQSGTSEVSEELLSECSLFLQQSGSSEAVVSFSLQQSLVSLSL